MTHEHYLRVKMDLEIDKENFSKDTFNKNQQQKAKNIKRST